MNYNFSHEDIGNDIRNLIDVFILSPIEVYCFKISPSNHYNTT